MVPIMQKIDAATEAVAIMLIDDLARELEGQKMFVDALAKEADYSDKNPDNASGVPERMRADFKREFPHPQSDGAGTSNRPNPDDGQTSPDSTAGQ